MGGHKSLLNRHLDPPVNKAPCWGQEAAFISSCSSSLGLNLNSCRVQGKRTPYVSHVSKH